MTLDHLLRNYDPKTASGVLAAAALSGLAGDFEFVPQALRRYADEGRAVIGEVRRQLNIAADDYSAMAKASVDRALATAIQSRFVPGAELNSALSRAGELGRVPPSFYSIDQSWQFTEKFRTLAVRPNHVVRAIKECDDYEHPLTRGVAAQHADAVSLFIKEVGAGRSSTRHWLLVQTHRAGLVQVVQSAWHIYSDAIDLQNARRPLDVLRAFALKFGSPIEVDGRKGDLFVEGFTRKKTSHISWGFQASGDFFASISNIDAVAPNEIVIGIGYCIMLDRYRSYLRDHGLMTNDQMMNFNQAADIAVKQPAPSISNQLLMAASRRRRH
jgi:hypothetical protein